MASWWIFLRKLCLSALPPVLELRCVVTSGLVRDSDARVSSAVLDSSTWRSKTELKRDYTLMTVNRFWSLNKQLTEAWGAATRAQQLLSHGLGTGFWDVWFISFKSTSKGLHPTEAEWKLWLAFESPHHNRERMRHTKWRSFKRHRKLKANSRSYQPRNLNEDFSHSIQNPQLSLYQCICIPVSLLGWKF